MKTRWILLVMLVVFFGFSSPASPASIIQIFSYEWTIDVWDHNGYVAARNWAYKPYTTFDSSLGTLTQVNITLLLNVEATEGDTFRYRTSFFTGWNPANYQFSADKWFYDGTWEDSIEWENIYTDPADLAKWVDPLYGPDGFAYLETTTFNAQHTIDAELTLAFKYSPVPEPATMFLLGFGLIGLAGLRRKLKR